MVNKAETSRSGKEETALPVAPEEASDEGGEEEAEEDDEVDIPAVLPLDNLALAQVADIGDTRLVAGLDEHPADVGEEEALVSVVRVEVGVGVAVVSTVATGPPLDGTLDGSGSSCGKEVLERLRRVIRPVGPQTMVARSDAWMGVSPD